MSGNEVGILIATALSPILLSFIFHIILKKSKRWGKIPFWWQQILIGIFFGGLAICSLSFGVKYSDVMETSTTILGTFGSATASPVIAGLIFGWPSGIIAGFIGAFFRLFINPFGVGDYLRAAECFSVLMAGVVAAILRKGLFDNKKPKWGYGFIIGILVETLHMVFIFLTGLFQKDINFAYAVIQQCDIPCAIVVTVAIVISLLLVSIYEKERITINFNDKTIASKVQKWMLASFLIAMSAASLLTYFAVSTNSNFENNDLLLNSARDVVYELETSPWGSESGWNNKNGDIDELQPITYTRRIRTNGYIVITGVSSNFDPNVDPLETNTSPMDVKEDVIYSVSADLDIYREQGQKLTFYDSKTGVPFSPSKMLEEENKPISVKININASGQFDFPPELEIHKASQMFKANLNDSKNIYPVYAVVVRARVTGLNDTDVNQEFNVVSILNTYEANMTMGLSLRIAIYIELFVFIAIYGVIYTFIKRAVVSNIQKINTSLEKITEGDLSVKVNVRSNTEFASLSDDINATVDTLKQYIEEAKKRMEQELIFAKSIQQGTLPYIFPTTIDFDLYADMKTAKQVGGDFYDFFPLTNRRLFFLIADVSGKGVPAAMFMMRAETLIKSLVQTDELTLEKVIENVNDELCTKNEAQMFVTCWCAILDIETGHVQFVNAGHNPPIVKRKDGKYEEIKVAKNFVLAGMENIPYRLEEFDLHPGDEIFIYTDGVTEATDKYKRLYGIERLLNFMNGTNYSCSRDLIDKLNIELAEFQKDVEQADDITMLMLRYKPDKKGD